MTTSIVTAVVGCLGYGLMMYPANWPILAQFHMPVEKNGLVMTLADLMGFETVRTGKVVMARGEGATYRLVWDSAWERPLPRAHDQDTPDAAGDEPVTVSAASVRIYALMT